MKTPTSIAALACAGTLALAGTAQAAAPPAPAPAPPSARTASIGTDIAGAFAAKLATSGATYLIGHLQSGALGGTGRSIGDFLSSVGLGDPNAPVLAELKVVNERLDVLKQSVNELGSKIDRLAADHANGVYSTNVALANPLRSAVMTAEEKLQRIAASPVHERHELAVAFVSYYERALADHERTFENYLTGGGVHGADGILQLSSKRARSAAQPFFTHAMSEFPRQVWNDYTLIQAVWLEEELNVLAFKHATRERVQQAISATNARIDREWAVMPRQTVFPNTVLDTRTGLLWSWMIDATPCAHLEDGPYARYNLCLYGHGHNASRAPFAEVHHTTRTSTWATNGSPPGGWKRPAVAELQKLDSGATGAAVPGWLHAQGGFPAAITGEVWTSAASGGSATTFNQSNGGQAGRPKGESHWSLLTGPVDDRPGQFWVG